MAGGCLVPRERDQRVDEVVKRPSDVLRQSQELRSLVVQEVPDEAQNCALTIIRTCDCQRDLSGVSVRLSQCRVSTDIEHSVRARDADIVPQFLGAQPAVAGIFSVALGVPPWVLSVPKQAQRKVGVV